MKFFGTPAGAGILVGLVLAMVSLFGVLPAGVEPWVGLGVLVVFAFWLSRWIRYRVFAPGIWLGVFILIWVAIIDTAFLPVYLANHPEWEGATTRGAFFGWAMLSVAVFSVLLALLATLFAIGPRRRDQARMAAMRNEMEETVRTT